MIELRQAVPEDATSLAELRWEFRSARGPNIESKEEFILRCETWMRAVLRSGAWRAWIAHDDSLAVGQIWLQLIDKIPNPTRESERHAYVTNVYVTPRARGGVGERLLRTALAAATAEGVDRIVLWPTAHSRTLYLRHGFRANLGVLELKCSGETDPR